MVDLDPVSEDDKEELYTMVSKHFIHTKSAVAKFVIDDFDNQLPYFVKVFPKDYKKVLERKSLEEVIN
jgi:glutamate synthase (NADPH/NADH) large chain